MSSRFEKPIAPKLAKAAILTINPKNSPERPEFWEFTELGCRKRQGGLPLDRFPFRPRAENHDANNKKNCLVPNQLSCAGFNDGHN
jgi:hypothetical protein